MQYFEKNIDNIDKELGEAHEVPSEGETFGYIFEGNNPYVYLPDATWHAMTDRDQIQYTRATERNGKLLINRDMKTMNNNAIAGGRGSSQSKAIGRTIDDEIVELRGGKVLQPLLNTVVKRGQAIDVNNKEKVDLSELADKGYGSVQQKKPPQTGAKTGKREEKRNNVDEQVYEALTNMGIDPYNY